MTEISSDNNYAELLALAEEFLDSASAELRESRCSSCDGPLTSFNLLLCQECAGAENREEFSQIAGGEVLIEI